MCLLFPSCFLVLTDERGRVAPCLWRLFPAGGVPFPNSRRALSFHVVVSLVAEPWRGLVFVRAVETGGNSQTQAGRKWTRRPIHGGCRRFKRSRADIWGLRCSLNLAESSPPPLRCAALPSAGSGLPVAFGRPRDPGRREHSPGSRSVDEGCAHPRNLVRTSPGPGWLLSASLSPPCFFFPPSDARWLNAARRHATLDRIPKACMKLWPTALFPSPFTPSLFLCLSPLSHSHAYPGTHTPVCPPSIAGAIIKFFSFITSALWPARRLLAVRGSDWHQDRETERQTRHKDTRGRKR